MRNILRGFGLFLAGGLLLALVGFPLQTALGAWGLVLTELITLAVAWAGTALFGFSPGSVFRVRPIGWRDGVGFVLMYLGGQSIAALLTALTALISPEVGHRLEQVEQATQLPIAVAVPVLVILPALCEEALFRGVLRRCFADLPPALAATVVGLMFGLFHLDPYRLVPTAVLGVAITYLCIKTDNLLPGVLYHALNNLTAVLMPPLTIRLPWLAVAAAVGVGCWLGASRILTKR